MSEMLPVKAIKSSVKKNRRLTEQEIDFCKWYSGSQMDAFGTASELDPIESAKRAGYRPDEAAEFAWKVRQDVALQLQIAVFNQNRRGETMAKLQGYSRRAADIVMNLAEEGENENVRLGAAKLLMQVGGIGESPEEMAQRRKQDKANDEFRSRLSEIKDVLGAKEVSYTPFTESKVAEHDSGEDGVNIPDEDDDIVG